GEDHQQRLVEVVAFVGPLTQPAQTRLTVAGGVDLQVQLLEGLGELGERHAGVVHQQHLASRGPGQQRVVQLLAGYPGVVGHDLGEHLLHVDHLHQLVIHAGDGGQVVGTTAATGRRLHLFPVEVVDALHAVHQERLHRAVVLGDDDGVGLRLQRTHADGLGQVDHRQGLTAQVDHPAYARMAMWHAVEARQVQDFLHLEDVDREELPTGKTEQQDFQAILTYQLGALIDRVENTRHVIT